MSTPEFVVPTGDTGGGRNSSIGGGTGNPDARRRDLVGDVRSVDAADTQLRDARFNPSPYEILDDIAQEWQTVPTEIRARMQQEMVAIGLLNPDTTRTNFFFGDGSLDNPTMAALQQVFRVANTNNEHWSMAYRRVLGNFQQGLALGFGGGSGSGGGGGGGGGAAMPTFRAPDPAAIREQIRATVSQAVGREMEEAEVGEFTAPLTDLYRKQFNAAVGGGTQVDPQARFNEMVREKYGTEMDLLGERQEFAATAQVDQANMSFIDRIAAGGAL